MAKTPPAARPHTRTPPPPAAAVDPAPAPTAVPGIRVEALKLGYYDNQRRRAGDVFTIDGTIDDRPELEVPTADGSLVMRKNPRYGQPIAFSDKWMRRVDPHTPEHITTGKEELERLRRDTQAARAESALLAHEAEDVIGAND